MAALEVEYFSDFINDERKLQCNRVIKCCLAGIFHGTEIPVTLGYCSLKARHSESSFLLLLVFLLEKYSFGNSIALVLSCFSLMKGWKLRQLLILLKIELIAVRMIPLKEMQILENEWIGKLQKWALIVKKKGRMWEGNFSRSLVAKTTLILDSPSASAPGKWMKGLKHEFPTKYSSEA